MADLTSNVEFDYSYSGSFLALGAQSVLSAFSLSSTVVSVTIPSMLVLLPNATINAGFNARITDISSSTQAGTIFDIGFTSSAAASSYYTTAPNVLTGPAAGGPGNAIPGFGTLELGGTSLSSVNTVSFKGSDNTLVLDIVSPPAILGLRFNNFQAAGDQIIINGDAAVAPVITGYNSATGLLTFTNGQLTDNIIFTGMAATDSVGNFTIGNAAVLEAGNTSTYAGNLVISYVPCFLRGTMIATPDGEVPVEGLRAGDPVTVLEHGEPVARPVRWMGSDRMRVADHPDPDRCYPIRIRCGAFGDGRPHRDLLVTQEHCILTEAGLVPARMLVNDMSITIDRSVSAYEFHHVELDRHGILLSEGLSTESYLDTGNRGRLGNAAPAGLAKPVILAAPLAISRAAVEPVWRRLDARARSLGLTPPAAAGTLLDDPCLRLILDDGSELDACWLDEARYMFRIPEGARAIRLTSRSSVPADVVGPFVDDRRTLGVAVSRLVFWRGLDDVTLAVPDLDLPGWHAAEGAHRWTNGDAMLDLPASDGEAVLDVSVSGTLPYRPQAI